MDNNAWFPDFDIPIPLPPIITAEICLCFDSYLSVEGLNEMIGLPAKCAEPRDAMRINLLTGRQNPGYWYYVLPSCADFGSESLTEQLCGLLTEHAAGFRAAMEKYAPAELILRFFVEAQEARQFPTISLSTEVLQIAASLGARVDVDVECHCCEEDDMLLLDPLLEERKNET